jgi:branched-subunit amino acid transport protein AzlD
LSVALDLHCKKLITINEKLIQTYHQTLGVQIMKPLAVNCFDDVVLGLDKIGLIVWHVDSLIDLS